MTLTFLKDLTTAKLFAFFVMAFFIIEPSAIAQLQLPEPPSTGGSTDDPVSAVVYVMLMVGAIIIGALVMGGCGYVFWGAFKKYKDVMNGKGEWGDVILAVLVGVGILVIGIGAVTYGYNYFIEATAGG